MAGLKLCIRMIFKNQRLPKKVEPATSPSSEEYIRVINVHIPAASRSQKELQVIRLRARKKSFHLHNNEDDFCGFVERWSYIEYGAVAISNHPKVAP
eukprot:scaffold6420_cov168-Amphora_coffeaeformis.AAC.11